MKTKILKKFLFLPSEERTVLHHLVHLFACLCYEVFVVHVAKDGVDHVNDAGHVGFFQATGGDGGSSHADTGGLER